MSTGGKASELRVQCSREKWENNILLKGTLFLYKKRVSPGDGRHQVRGKFGGAQSTKLCERGRGGWEPST